MYNRVALNGIPRVPTREIVTSPGQRVLLPAEATEVVEAIRHGWRHNPAQYVRTEIKGSEAAYRSWPAAIRCLLDPARVIEASKCSDRIEPAGKGAA